MALEPSSADNIMLERIKQDLELVSINAYDDLLENSTHIIFMDQALNPYRINVTRVEQNDEELIKQRMTDEMTGGPS